MRKEFTLIVLLFLTLIVYSQDYKVEKLKIVTKGDYKISRLLIIPDYVSNDKVKLVSRQNAIGQVIIDTIYFAGINKFISDFTSALKGEFEKHELDFTCIKEITADDVVNGQSCLENLNPNGILAFRVSNAFLEYRGFTQKNGVYFVLGLSYRPNSEDNYIPLFSSKIKVMVDSFENSGELAAKDFFNLMAKKKYLKLIK
jgi:hypothetical protein